MNIQKKNRTAIVWISILLLGIAGGWGVLNRLSRLSPSASETARLKEIAPPRMALIPAGEFWAGTDEEDADEDAKPKRKVFLPSYYMDKYEVTNREYQLFDPKHPFAKGDEELPVSAVTYDEAFAYAKWAGKRLPTNDEWEKAARGVDGRKYPWGNDWSASKVAKRRRTNPKDKAPETDSTLKSKACHVGPSRLQPGGSVPESVSPFGCYDMAGNAWEWVQGYFNDDSTKRILRGGAVGYGERACRTYIRSVEGAGDT